MEIERYKMIYSKVKTLDGLLNGNGDYQKFDNKKTLNEIMNDDIRILGECFAKRNINKAKIIIKNKKYILKEYINSNKFLDDKMKINIILSKDLSDISHMFENCPKLKEFSIHDKTMNISEEEEEEAEEIYQYDNDYDENDNDTQNNFYKNLKYDNVYSFYSEITDMYNSCDTSTLNYFIGNIKINQYHYFYNMNSIFSNCISLELLTDISKWDTSNVINMSKMFYFCVSLLSLPDISKWNISNVTDVSGMFSSYELLIAFPDILMLLI